MEKEHDFPDHLLLGPGLLDPLTTLRTDALHLLKALRLVLNDVEDLIAKFFYQFRGVDGSNSLYHAASKIFLDPLKGGRWLGLEFVCLELDPVFAVFFPGSLCSDPFAGRHCGESAQHGNRLFASLHLHLEDAEPVLFIMKGDPLHLTAQRIIGTTRDRFVVRFFAESSAWRHWLRWHGNEFPPILRSVKIAYGMRGGTRNDCLPSLSRIIPTATHTEFLPR